MIKRNLSRHSVDCSGILSTSDQNFLPVSTSVVTSHEEPHDSAWVARAWFDAALAQKGSAVSAQRSGRHRGGMKTAAGYRCETLITESGFATASLAGGRLTRCRVYHQVVIGFRRLSALTSIFRQVAHDSSSWSVTPTP